MAATSTLGHIKQRIVQAVAVERVDDNGEVVVPRGLDRAVVRTTQAMVERGLTPPWALSREGCQRFWQTRVDDANAPITYADKPTEIVDFLDSFWRPQVTLGDTVLELGCNAGTNLNRLRELGYENLQGIEINPAAVAELERIYPELGEMATIETTTIEAGLAGRGTGSVDVIYTMAVLIHLHPSSNAVFADLVRVARGGYMCVVELEHASNNYVFPRDYRRLFARLGCTEVRSETFARETHPDVSRAYDGYVARLFRTPV